MCVLLLLLGVFLGGGGGGAAKMFDYESHYLTSTSVVLDIEQN